MPIHPDGGELVVARGDHLCFRARTIHLQSRLGLALD